MINRKLLVESAARALNDCLRARGFGKYLRAREEFVRNLDQRQDRLAIEVFKWANADEWNLTFRLKIRFEPIELLRNGPDAAADARHSTTLTKLIDNLYPKTIDRFQWPISRADDVAAAAPEMKVRIDTYALPFFQRFRDLAAVRQAMESELGDWPVPTPQARAEVLLASLAMMGDAAGLSGWIPKLRRELATLQGGAYRDRLESFLARLSSAFPQLIIA